MCRFRCIAQVGNVTVSQTPTHVSTNSETWPAPSDSRSPRSTRPMTMTATTNEFLPLPRRWSHCGRQSAEQRPSRRSAVVSRNRPLTGGRREKGWLGNIAERHGHMQRLNDAPHATIGGSSTLGIYGECAPLGRPRQGVGREVRICIEAAVGALCRIFLAVFQLDRETRPLLLMMWSLELDLAPLGAAYSSGLVLSKS